jgi:hypothetical protein
VKLPLLLKQLREPSWRGYRLEAMDPTKSPRLLDSRQQSFTEVPMRLIGVALYLLSHRVRAFAPVARS